MHIPNFEHQARTEAKVLGYRLIRAARSDDTTLYGWVEFAQWSGTSPDRLDRLHWYELRFKPLGTRRKNIWSSESPNTEAQVNRLHFSLLERTAAHPEGAASVAKLGPIGHIRTYPKSIGLGTYLRDQLIDWVASLHPDASVAKGSLSSVDAGADNLERRNRFYLGGNFQIRVEDDGSGAFWADRLDDLGRSSKSGNVVELTKEEVHGLLQCVSELEKATKKVSNLDEDCRRLKTVADKAQQSIRWAKMGVTALFVALWFATAQGKLSWHLF